MLQKYDNLFKKKFIEFIEVVCSMLDAHHLSLPICNDPAILQISWLGMQYNLRDPARERVFLHIIDN